jgi:hypothetical protein
MYIPVAVGVHKLSGANSIALLAPLLPFYASFVPGRGNIHLSLRLGIARQCTICLENILPQSERSAN